MAKIIISYDCEGVWGMADKLEKLDLSVFNHKSLIHIYMDLIKLHEKYNLRATFAFVGAFVSTKNEFLDTLNSYPNAVSSHKWIKSIATSKNNLTDEDIFIPEIMEVVTNSIVEHEIASHGYSHLIMNSDVDDESLDLELAGIKKVANKYKTKIKTFIFPRNVVNARFLDKAKFLVAFRKAPKSLFRNRILKRAYSLVKEFIPYSSSQLIEYYDKKVAIPGDFFINWRSGLRRYVPIWLTVFRFKMAVNHAVKNNGIVHIWLHPHNLATGKNQFFLLEKIFSVIKDYSKNELVAVCTQDEILND
jgi:peptidoglycan/xylan/chitin deacetylase (PgdA/CDA1 family)